MYHEGVISPPSVDGVLSPHRIHLRQSFSPGEVKGGLIMRTSKRRILVGAPTVPCISLLNVAVPQASAEPVAVEPYVNRLCEPGSSTISLSGAVKAEKLTHAGRFVNSSSVAQTGTYAASVVNTLTSSVTRTAGGTFEAAGVIAKLSVTSNVAFASSGSKTTTVSQSMAVTMPPMTTFVLAAGRTAVDASRSSNYCASATTIVKASGKVSSFSTAQIMAVAQCNKGSSRLAHSR